MNQKPIGSVGLTLIEVLVVVVILGVLVGLVALVRTDFLPAYEIRQASLQVASHLRLARSKALSHNTPVELVFPADGTAYRARWLNPDADPERWEDYALYARGEGARGNTAEVSMPSSTTIGEVATVRFQPRGTLDVTLDNQVAVAHELIEDPVIISVQPNGIVAIP